MDIQDSALYREIANIQTDGSKPVHYSYRGQIHANGQTIDAMKVIEVDILRDYELQYSDTIIVRMQFPQGTYFQDIFPYQDALECTLFKDPLNEQGASVDLNQSMQTERYTCIINQTEGSPLLEQTGWNDDSKDTLDLKDFADVHFQLVDRALYQMRMMEAGSNFRNCTPEQALRAIMTSESQQVQVDQQRVIKGVDMVPSNNQTVRDHVQIPDGTPLVHIPQYIHQKCGGVYSAGLGYFLQNDIWYIYPIYDPTRGANKAAALTIINIPKNRFPGVERTYRMDGNNLVIMGTGDVKFRDLSNPFQLNKGNGVRFAAADKIIDSYANVKNNIAVASRGAINTEVATTARPDGLNNAKTSARRLNANPYLEYSEMAKRNGSQMAFTWENSDPSLLYPGMLTTVIYQDGDTIQQVSGVLLKNHSHVRMQGSGMTSQRHITETGLSVFVQRPVGNGVSTGPGVTTPT